MGTKTVIGGIASEYDDQILWIERAEVGADAAQIVDESEYTPCKVTKIISRNDYDSEEEYSDWISELSPIAIQDFKDSHEYWQQKRVKILDDIQSWMMDSYLKSNNVSEGADDYIGVVGMIITMDSAKN